MHKLFKFQFFVIFISLISTLNGAKYIRDLVKTPDKISCAFESSTCGWYSEGGSSDNMKWHVNDSTRNKDIPKPNSGDRFLLLRSKKREEEADIIWSPAFRVDSQHVTLSLSIFCSYDAHMHLHLIEYENGLTPQSFLIFDTNTQSKSNVWYNITNYDLEDEFEEYETKVYQFFIRGQVKGENAVAIKSLLVDDGVSRTTIIETEAPVTKTVTDISEKTEATDESIISSATPFITESPLDNCDQRLSKVNKLEETSCSFVNSKCCWYSKGGSPGIKWKLSTSTKSPEVPLPKRGSDGFIMLKSNNEDRKWDMIWSPKFAVYSPYVTMSASVYCTSGADIELQLIEYKDGGELRHGYPILDVDENVSKNTWYSIKNIDLSEDFENFEGKLYQIFLQGQVNASEVIAIRNLKLKNYIPTTTSAPETTFIETTINVVSDITTSSESVTSEDVTGHTSDSKTITEEFTILEPTVTESPFADCDQYLSQVHYFEEISCNFHDSTCCWYTYGGSPGMNWILSNATATSDVPSPEDESGFLMIKSNNGERKWDMIWSPKFTVKSKNLTLSITAYCSEGANLTLQVVEYQNDQPLYGLPIVNINEKVHANSWHDIVDLKFKEAGFENVEGRTFQIFLQGQVKETEVIAVKNLKFRNHVVEV